MKWLHLMNAVCGGFIEDSEHIWVVAPHQVINAIPDWPPPMTYDYDLVTVLNQDSNADTFDKCDFSLFKIVVQKLGWHPHHDTFLNC
jgi:hypothetical protein